MSAGPAMIQPVEGPASGNGAAPPDGERGSLGLGPSFHAMIRPVSALTPRRLEAGAEATVSAPVHHRLRISEADLIQGYGAGSAPLVEPCACGSLIVCISSDIPSGVAAHNATPEHRGWREAGGLQAPSFDVPIRDRRWRR